MKPEINDRSFRWAVPPLIVLLFSLIFHMFWDHTIIMRDAFLTFAPSKFLVAEALKKGDIYFWNPYLLLGLPCVAEIHYSWFYPLNALFPALDFGAAHRLYILVHYPLAASTMYLFLRGRDLPRGPALLGGLAFALCGYLISQHSVVRTVAGASWAPLAFYFMDRALKGRLVWAALAGAVMAVQVIAAAPLTAGVTAAVFAAAVAIPTIIERTFLKGFAIVSIAGISSILLSAVQTIPTRELIGMTERSGGLSLKAATSMSLHPVRLIELIWPLPFGSYWPESCYWGRFTVNVIDKKINHPWALTNYIGLAVTALALIGMVSSKRKWKWAVGAGAVVFLFLSFGGHTPVYSWFHAAVPIFDQFRYPEKYMAWFSGLVVILAALGLESLGRFHDENPGLVSKWGLAYAGAAIVGGLAGIKTLTWMVGEYSMLEPGSYVYEHALINCSDTGRHFILINALLGFSIFIMARNRAGRAKLFAAVLAVVVLDLYLGNVRTMPTGPPDIFDFRTLAESYANPESESTLGEYRIHRRDMNFRDTNPALQDLSFYTRQQVWERNTLQRNLNFIDGLEEISGYGPYRLEPGGSLLHEGMTPRLMAVYNVRYLIGPYEMKPPADTGSRLIKRDRLNDLSVIELTDCLPRAYWVPAAVEAADQDEAMKLLDTVDLRQKVIVTSPMDDIGPSEDGDFRPAEITLYETDRVVVKTSSETDGWLVLSDRWQPGWEARIDGEPSKIHTANVMVRAVIVPAGTHEIVFSYKPDSFHKGALISGIAWPVLLIWVALSFLRSHKKENKKGESSSA